MAKAVYMIGLQAEEIAAAKLLIALLRHPDPMIQQLTTEAVRYVESVAATRGIPDHQVLNNAS